MGDGAWRRSERKKVDTYIYMMNLITSLLIFAFIMGTTCSLAAAYQHPTLTLIYLSHQLIQVSTNINLYHNSLILFDIYWHHLSLRLQGRNWRNTMSCQAGSYTKIWNSTCSLWYHRPRTTYHSLLRWHKFYFEWRMIYGWLLAGSCDGAPSSS